MSRAERQDWGRVCEIVAWQAAQVALGVPNGTAEIRKTLADGLLQPEDEESVKIDGQLWRRRQCARCAMAILRPVVILPQQTQAMLDISQGECVTHIGRDAMTRYRKWPEITLAQEEDL